MEQMTLKVACYPESLHSEARNSHGGFEDCGGNNATRENETPYRGVFSSVVGGEGCACVCGAV